MAHPKPIPVPAGHLSTREVARILRVSKKEYADTMRMLDRILKEPEAPRARPDARAKRAVAKK